MEPSIHDGLAQLEIGRAYIIICLHLTEPVAILTEWPVIVGQSIPPTICRTIDPATQIRGQQSATMYNSSNGTK